MKNDNIVEIVKYNTKQHVDGRLPISTSTDIGSANLVLMLKEKCPELQTIAKITRGVHPYRTGGYGKTAFGSGPQTSLDVKKRSYHGNYMMVINDDHFDHDGSLCF
jgi:hypothetical protein